MKNKLLAFILCTLVVFVFGCGPTKLELIFEVKEKEIVATNFGLEADNVELEEAFTELEVDEKVSDTTPKYYIRKPMYSDDAKLLLEEKQWPFLMFHNAETEQINVAHMTESGEFRTIQPL